MQKYDIVDVDLKGGSLFRSFNNVMIGEGDTAGNKYGMRMKDNGEDVDLSGASCVGFFIRPDGITLVIDGKKDGNVAYVELPQAAYAKAGQFTLSIKVSGTGIAETMRIVDGTVIKTTTGRVSDPSSVIPTIEELTEVIEDAEAAAESINALSIGATVISGTRYKISMEVEE